MDNTQDSPEKATPPHSWHHPARWGAVLIGFVGSAIISGVVTMALGGRVFVKPTVQPINFNHKKHVHDNGLTCDTCHQFYETEAFSGLPSAEVCASCHIEPQGKSAEEAKLVGMLKSGAELKWQPLFRQPAHIFYSHRRHVVVAKLECPTCHGAIGESEGPPARVRKLRMQNCIDCHTRSSVSTDCTACHR